MRRHATVLASLATALSCGGGRLGGPDGAAGGPGSGGGGSVGGDASDGATLSACGDPSAPLTDMSFVIAGSDGVALTQPASATVTVTSVQSCATASCTWTQPAGPSGGPFTASSTTATKVVLAAPGSQQWTLYVELPDLPAAFFAMRDTFDMTVEASVDTNASDSSLQQSIVLARGGSLALFVASYALLDFPLLLDLSQFGVVLADAGALCAGPPFFGCSGRPHAVRVTVGTDAAVVPGTTTVTVGWLSFTNSVFAEQVPVDGVCSMRSVSFMGGFRTP